MWFCADVQLQANGLVLQSQTKSNRIIVFQSVYLTRVLYWDCFTSIFISINVNQFKLSCLFKISIYYLEFSGDFFYSFERIRKTI